MMQACVAQGWPRQPNRFVLCCALTPTVPPWAWWMAACNLAQQANAEFLVADRAITFACATSSTLVQAAGIRPRAGLPCWNLAACLCLCWSWRVRACIVLAWRQRLQHMHAVFG